MGCVSTEGLTSDSSFIVQLKHDSTPARKPQISPAMSRLGGSLFLLLLTTAAAIAAPKPLAIESGEIDGAKFSIARPAQWNRHLLLVAHGLRSANQPLAADLDPARPAYHALIAEGWIVATTSFRRNGVVIADGI